MSSYSMFEVSLRGKSFFRKKGTREWYYEGRREDVRITGIFEDLLDRIEFMDARLTTQANRNRAMLDQTKKLRKTIQTLRQEARDERQEEQG